jgi:hypothetical protein
VCVCMRGDENRVRSVINAQTPATRGDLENEIRNLRRITYLELQEISLRSEIRQLNAIISRGGYHAKTFGDHDERGGGGKRSRPSVCVLLE